MKRNVVLLVAALALIGCGNRQAKEAEYKARLDADVALDRHAGNQYAIAAPRLHRAPGSSRLREPLT
jgi:hypothetical protein